MLILLSGGSKSGKSMLAQELTRRLAQGGPMYYWAAMEPTDEEDLARIRRHRQERLGWGYETVEQGRDLEAAFSRVDPRGTVLFDSSFAECFAYILDFRGHCRDYSDSFHFNFPFVI